MTEYAVLAEQPIVVDIKLTDDLFIRTALVRHKGTVLPGHAHRWSHVTLLSVGKMRIWADDALLGDFSGPTGILIAAEVKHRMMTLTDGVQFSCVHALHGTNEVEIHEMHDPHALHEVA